MSASQSYLLSADSVASSSVCFRGDTSEDSGQRFLPIWQLRF